MEVLWILFSVETAYIGNEGFGVIVSSVETVLEFA